jgi:hypothetical protein
MISFAASPGDSIGIKCDCPARQVSFPRVKLDPIALFARGPEWSQSPDRCSIPPLCCQNEALRGRRFSKRSNISWPRPIDCAASRRSRFYSKARDSRLSPGSQDRRARVPRKRTAGALRQAQRNGRPWNVPPNGAGESQRIDQCRHIRAEGSPIVRRRRLGLHWRPRHSPQPGRARRREFSR